MNPALAVCGIDLPALKASKSVFAKELPPILIVFESTSKTEAVICWKAPEIEEINLFATIFPLALILPEAVIFPSKVKLVPSKVKFSSPLRPAVPV